MKKAFTSLFFIFFSFLGHSQNTILWKVTAPDSIVVSYVLGTYHYMGNSFVDSYPIIKEKVIQSELSIFESIDDPDKLIKIINNRPKSNGNEKNLSRSDIKYLKEFSSNWAVDFNKLKPAELLVKLQQEYYKRNCGTIKPTDEWNHFERYLITIARQNSVKVLGLESDSLQAELINKDQNNPNWRENRKFLQYWIKKTKELDPDDPNCIFAKDYMDFKLDYRFDEECTESVLLKERNANWMEVLPDYLNNRSCFVAVGLFHLNRKCGLLEELKDKGFFVEEVWMEAKESKTATDPKK